MINADNYILDALSRVILHVSDNINTTNGRKYVLDVKILKNVDVHSVSSVA